MANNQRLGLRVDSQFSGVAIVVDAIVAAAVIDARNRGTEEVSGRIGSAGTCNVTIRIEWCTIRVNHVILDQRVAVTRRGKCYPVVRQIVVQPRAGIEGVVGVGRAPGLVAQHRRSVNLIDVRHRLSAQQLVTAAVALHLMLVLEVALQNRLRAELPVRRACAHRAPAVGVVHIALNFFAGQIHPRAHLLATAKQPPKINRAKAASSLIGGQIDGLDHRRPLGHVVNQPARGGHAALHAGNALENLDALFVFQRHILLASDGHAVDLQARGQVNRKAANLVDAVIAHRHVIVAHRGVVPHHVREQERALVAEHIARDHGDRLWRLDQWNAIQISHRDNLGKILARRFAMHHHSGRHARNLLWASGGLGRGLR